MSTLELLLRCRTFSVMPSAPKEPLHERIKALRLKMGLSREQFGKLFSVSPRTIESWEQNRRAPQGLVLAAVEKEIARRMKK
jgi:DNA-binding transcriptional regulator YiaG